MSNQSPPKEIEFKFAVDSPDAFARLLSHMGESTDLLETGIEQVNHFFDTRDRGLQSIGSIVRLREQEGQYRLTLKGRTTTEHGKALTERIEYEAMLDHARAGDVLHDRQLPTALLMKAFRGHKDAVAMILHRAGAGDALPYVGNFRNIRIKLPVSVQTGARTHDLVFELDSSCFPNNVKTWEIEVEIPDRNHAEDIQSALIRLLADAGVTWHTTTNKAERFFSALEK